MGSLSSLSMGSVEVVGILAGSRFSVSSAVSLIVGSLESFNAKDVPGFPDVLAVLERDLNLAVRDLIV